MSFRFAKNVRPFVAGVDIQDLFAIFGPMLEKKGNSDLDLNSIACRQVSFLFRFHIHTHDHENVNTSISLSGLKLFIYWRFSLSKDSVNLKL